MRTTAVAWAAGVVALFVAMVMSAGAATADSTSSPGGSASGVQVSPATPTPGATVHVRGHDCSSHARVTVYVDRQPVTSGTTDANGSYDIPVTMPDDTAQGTHRLRVAGAGCAGSGVRGISVVAATDDGGSNHTGTGVAVVGIGAVGVVLLVGGGTMLLAGRRRRRD